MHLSRAGLVTSVSAAVAVVAWPIAAWQFSHSFFTYLCGDGDVCGPSKSSEFAGETAIVSWLMFVWIGLALLASTSFLIGLLGLVLRPDGPRVDESEARASPGEQVPRVVSEDRSTVPARAGTTTGRDRE
jgi:hypothetical protein